MRKFKLFRKKSNSGKCTKSQLVDFEGNPLKPGDFVQSLRYDLGKCKLLPEGKGFVYESVQSGKQVHWSKMIDASTGNQKVRKIFSEEGD